MSSSRDFDYPLVLCKDFDSILTRQGVEASIDQVVEVALRRGRLLLQAAGGAGKTRTLEKIAVAAARANHRVSSVQVQKISKAALETDGVDALLRAAEPPLTYEELAGGDSLLLLVDGLSEASSGTAELVLNAVDEWAAMGPSTGTVVADRLTRRPVNVRRWQFATLGPVPRHIISEVVAREVSDWETGLLESPVNLDIIASMPGELLSSRSQAIERLTHRDKLSEVDWDGLESLALRVYRERGRRSIPTAWMHEVTGEGATTALEAAGLITRLGADEISFRHHLVHDYLAAKAASRNPVGWTHDLFDVLTLTSSSYDVLVMLLELIQEEQRDILIRRVYDWNLYAASYLLSRDRSAHGTTDLTTESEILALLGERRFDHFLATRRQVEDALALHGGPLATSYRQASSVEEVIELARNTLPKDALYRSWLVVFACDESPSPLWLVERMREIDGVDGWTAANVVRRLGVDSGSRESIQALLDADSAVVRWRAVHALGVAGNPVLDDLFAALENDESASVRFGALRSLVDQAYFAESIEVRSRIFRDLASHTAQILADPNLSRELARVLHVDNAPDGWIQGASIAIESILAVESDPAEQEKWRRVGSSVRSGKLEMV